MVRRTIAKVAAAALAAAPCCAAFAVVHPIAVQRAAVGSPLCPPLRAELRKDADGRVRKSTADEETDLNGYANPMAKGAYVEDGWVDESAASSGPGFFASLFGGGGKSAAASKLAARDRLNAELDVIEFVDGSKGSLTDAARGGTAVPFGGLNPAQVEAYDVTGEKTDGEKTPWGGYAPMPESAVEFFIKYPEKAPGAKPLPAGWYSAEDEASGQVYLLRKTPSTALIALTLPSTALITLTLCATAVYLMRKTTVLIVLASFLGILLQGGRHHDMGTPSLKRKTSCQRRMQTP